MKFIGVDIGGSHITAAEVKINSLTLNSGTYQRERVDAGGDVSEIIRAWSSVIKKCAGNEKDIKIGIAMPGPFDYENGISLMKNQGKYDALYQLNAKELLAEALQISVANIKMNNDAACFLQGEVYKVEKSLSRCVGVTLGTGLGTAFMIDGKAFDADLWNTPFKNGIMEDYISSRWFVSEFKARAGKEIKDVKELVEQHSEQEITEKLFTDFKENLSAFLLYFLKKKDAECIVIGGNIAKAEAFFLNHVKEAVYAGVGQQIPIYISSLGEQAALIGASTLFYQPK